MLALLTYFSFVDARAGSIDPAETDTFLGYTIGDERDSIREKCGGECPSSVDFAGVQVKPVVTYCDGEHVGLVEFRISVEKPQSPWTRAHDRRTKVIKADDVEPATHELIASIRHAHHAEGWTTTETPFGLWFTRGTISRSLIVIDTFPADALLWMRTAYLNECDFRLAI